MKTSHTTQQHELTYTRFDGMVEKYPRHTAVIYLGERFSYARLDELSRRLAGALQGLGIQKGDRVMVYIAN